MANQSDHAVLQASDDGPLSTRSLPQAHDPPDADFVALVAEQTEPLERTARRLIRNPSDAADLVQDTVEKALRCWRRFRPGSRIRAWLLTIMTNLFLDRCRRRNREVALEIDPEQPSLELDEPPSWSRLSEEQVRRAVAALEPAMREVYQLRVVQQLAYQAMSERLGIPVATVGTRLNRARLKLRALLERELHACQKEEP
jgi:RNA polymerase sigma-70 factor, ECF subfamily